MILVNPSFSELLPLASPYTQGVRAVIMGQNMGVADALKATHQNIGQHLMQSKGVAEPHLEIFISAEWGDYKISCTNSHHVGMEWQGLIHPKQWETLKDICKLLEEGVMQ